MALEDLEVRTMAEMLASGENPEVLFWVGCAGSFDDRAQKITRAFVKILNSIGVSFAILGKEESCTGDPAKRAGNEFLFQMQAMANIEILNAYNVKKIVTTCPHGFNIFKNEYPQLGGNYEVMHHTQFLQSLIAEGKLKVEGGGFEGKTITFHDPCYLGRGNGEYEAPRSLIETLDTNIVEMKRSKEKGFCCGAGGAQIFKESEPGRKEINDERMEDVKEVKADIVATACPFCMTMMTDGAKSQGMEKKTKIMDLAELIATSNGLIDENN